MFCFLKLVLTEFEPSFYLERENAPLDMWLRKLGRSRWEDENWSCPSTGGCVSVRSWRDQLLPEVRLTLFDCTAFVCPCLGFISPFSRQYCFSIFK